MFIVAKMKVAQDGLKGQCVLVPTDLDKTQAILPRSCDEEHLISLALKRRLTDKSVVNKQQVCLVLVNTAPQKSAQINPFYSNITIAAEFYGTEIIQVIAHQFGEILTDEQVNEMDCSTKVNYLKRNPVPVASQIDYVFKQLWGKVILSGMHPIGQILNFDGRRDF